MTTQFDFINADLKLYRIELGKGEAQLKRWKTLKTLCHASLGITIIFLIYLV